jgi:hypothetical protein
LLDSQESTRGIASSRPERNSNPSHIVEVGAPLEEAERRQDIGGKVAKKKVSEFIDFWSALVIALTVILFALALFLHGFTHDLLLEGGVLLVSAKLVIMSYKNGILWKQLDHDIHEIKTSLDRLQKPPAT